MKGHVGNPDRKPQNQNGQEVEATTATGLPVKAHPENLLGHKAPLVASLATDSVGVGTEVEVLNGRKEDGKRSEETGEDKARVIQNKIVQ